MKNASTSPRARTKACFERIITYIAYYYKNKTNNLDSLKQILAQIKDGNEKAERIYIVLTRKWDFYDYLISRERAYSSERDTVAHRGSIPFRPFNIMINPNTGNKILQLSKYNKEVDPFTLPSLVESMKEILDEFINFMTVLYLALFAD